jgi:enoyl-CoA hydratase
MGDASGPVTTTIEDGVAVLRFDDGKANVLSFAAIDSFDAALDRAAAEARSVCIVGREGKLCAGFDLSVMTGGPAAARDLVVKGGELLMRIYQHPQPVTVAVTGHALAAGALLVLACDVRIGADVRARIGLNETSIGMALPLFAIALAEDRLAKTALTAATLGAETYDPHRAVAAGYLDRVVAEDAAAAEAIAEARRLGEYNSRAYAQTKEVLRAGVLERVRVGGEADIARLSVEIST